MSRRGSWLVLALVAAVLVAIPGPVRAATTLFVDINDVDCDDNTIDSSVDPYCTIQAAIADAIAGDTVDIAAGTYTGATNPMITIGVDLTLVGAGIDTTILDAQSARVALNIASGSVDVSDLTVRNGLGAGLGANILYSASGSTLTLTDVKISGGSGSKAGGLGLGTGTTANLLRVEFVGNVSTGTIGGGGGGAAISADTSPVTLTVTDSTFTSNTSAAHGGAIRAYVSGGVTVVGSTFTDNESTGGLGGAISFHATGGSFTITDSTFVSNAAAAGGGGVDLGLGDTTISGSLFTGNTSSSVGGGLYGHDSSLLIVTNSTFHDNDALGSGGGAYSSKGFFVNTTFSLNSSSTSGGGLSQAGGSVHLANSTLAGNTAGSDGPDCYHLTSEGHNLVLDDTDCFIAGDLTGNVTGVDPFLRPLADNGGSTMSMALPLASPARNSGNPDPFDPTDWDAADDAGDGDWSCAATDQRGTNRTDVRCDGGAYELGRVIRFAGANRYATAAAISADHFPGGADEVFVATGANFPDALAGAAIANLANAPLLLVTATEVPSETAAELARLNPTQIVVLGGTGAISDTVKDALDAYGTTTRVWGATRYLTAVAISQYGFPTDGTADTVFVATGLNFPDALAAGPAAAALNGPVLLVPGDASTLPQEVADEILRLDPATIVVVGGTGAVSANLFDALVALQLDDTETRVFGASRYTTAVAVSDYAFPTADLGYIATGLNFPDALAGAAAALDAPILLVPGSDSSVPAEVEAELIALGAAADGTAVILGGTGVVSTAIETDLGTIFAS